MKAKDYKGIEDYMRKKKEEKNQLIKAQLFVLQRVVIIIYTKIKVHAIVDIAWIVFRKDRHVKSNIFRITFCNDNARYNYSYSH